MAGLRWTAKEDEILKTYSIKSAAFLLKGSRTVGAVRDRRRHLGMSTGLAISSPWTSREDEIVRSNSDIAAIELLKGKRTRAAIRHRRCTIGATTARKRWTKKDDCRIRRTALLPLSKVTKFFRDRTPKAIQARRYELSCELRRGPVTVWKNTEVKLLREMWPSFNLSDIAAAIPRHRLEGIRGKAGRLGLHKAMKAKSADLLDQIKIRAREDGIGLRGLAAELGCNPSFLAHRPNAKHDFNKISKAVEFFGGRLVIDWQDE